VQKWENDDIEGRTDVTAVWSVQRQKALPLVAGDSSSSVHKLCPQVMSSPAACRYRTLRLKSNRVWTLVVDVWFADVRSSRSLSLLIGYLCCLRIVRQSMFACFSSFLSFFFFNFLKSVLDTGGWSGKTHQIFGFLIFYITSVFNFHPTLLLCVNSHAVYL